MASPRLDKAITDQMQALLAEFETALGSGDYSPRVQRDRFKHARDFVLFAEGRFNPADEKGKIRHATN
ncbi:hypothetical protein ACVCAH_11500 [Micromonospora sp. LZ34]